MVVAQVQPNDDHRTAAEPACQRRIGEQRLSIEQPALDRQRAFGRQRRIREQAAVRWSDAAPGIGIDRSPCGVDRPCDELCERAEALERLRQLAEVDAQGAREARDLAARPRPTVVPADQIRNQAPAQQ
jgi:hypothetical protein